MLKLSFLQAAPTWMVALVIFLFIIGFYLLGYHFEARKIARNGDITRQEFRTISGILLGLLSLLLAFAFGMANSRYDKRREVTIQEANDIGTAILRADLYPDTTRIKLRNDFKEYVEARIAFYKAGMNVDEITYYYLKADSIGKKIWKTAANDARINNVIVRAGQMIPAINAMIDITTTRRGAGEATIPDNIMYFLFGLCFCSAFLTGYDNKGKIDWTLVMGFALIMSITVFMILDLDRPRSGFINLDVANQKIIELRSMFK